jgi:hypothetical protein
LSRCTKAISICRTDPWPPLTEVGAGHAAACYNPVFQPEATTA